MKYKNKNSLIFSFAIIIIALFGLSYFFFFSEEDEYHKHADFKVYLGESEINFSDTKYQSSAYSILDESVHLHDGNGEVIHHHDSGITLSRFFDSLGMNFTNNCFSVNSSLMFCENSSYTLDTYVNGELIENAPAYVFEDLDRILIYYGIGSPTEEMFDSVSDRACIESALCPERGEPSEGSCVTGSTCVVDLDQIMKENE